MGKEEKIVKTFRKLSILIRAYKIYFDLCKEISREFNMGKLAFKRDGANDVFANDQICFCITRLSIPNSKYEYIQVATYYENSKYLEEARRCIKSCSNFLLAEDMEEIKL